ncbi:MAG TPA: hypothetical protein O0X25_01750 [Methanocorpusculum sp.]|nr:hypothetical protein [Methanocorpusculum sp.]HJJ39721.1 hypothetical protein [Methanocorpusculum sp.]HJJ49330.1 hypothetical protein [Methanocorpusculum sp.]HJJ56626.1 hypothetical protein [Methanocorpusculum sp.]
MTTKSLNNNSATREPKASIIEFGNGNIVQFVNTKDIKKETKRLVRNVRKAIKQEKINEAAALDKLNRELIEQKKIRKNLLEEIARLQNIIDEKEAAALRAETLRAVLDNADKIGYRRL